MKAHLLAAALLASARAAAAVQTWSEQPRYQEVNPGGEARLACVVNDIRGECRWERDGIPLTVYPDKYEWAGRPETGDCTLRVLDARLEYDDGVWQCQVTPSSFRERDALISEGAQLVVRREFDMIELIFFYLVITVTKFNKISYLVLR